MSFNYYFPPILFKIIINCNSIDLYPSKLNEKFFKFYSKTANEHKREIIEMPDSKQRTQNRERGEIEKLDMRL